MDDGPFHGMINADLEVILLDADEQHLQCQVVDRCSGLFYQFTNLFLMITFVLVDSWTGNKSRDKWLMERRHTFKSHIRTGRKLVTLEWPLELHLQGGTSDFSILLVFFVCIIYLRDEIVEFREDRHNRNCLCLVTMKIWSL